MEVAAKKSTGGGGKGESGICGMVATLPHDIITALNGSGCKNRKGNNQLEVAKEAAAVVAWQQLPCNKVAACSTKWKWLKKKQSTGGDGGGKGGSGSGGMVATAV